MARREHLGVVTGLADLVNFLVAARHEIASLPHAQHAVAATLFGPGGSLPEDLRAEFLSITRAAFPDIGADIYNPAKADAQIFEPELRVRRPGIGQRTVYGNLVHKPLFQKFFAALGPDAFIFFDNGLSSYWDHRTDICSEFASRGLPAPRLAALSMAPPLDIPDYLKAIPIWHPGANDHVEVHAAIRRALGITIPRDTDAVILGSSIFRSGILTWEEERGIYLRLIDQLGRRRGIVFKGHPRAAARPLLHADDGVAILDTTAPIEALVEPGRRGQVFGMASTALITMPKYLGWKSYRIDTEETRRSADRLAHQRLAHIVETWPR